MAAGKGFDHYRNSYTHDELWSMLQTDGDPWSVEQAGSLWRTAKGGLEVAREEMITNVQSLRTQWDGEAAEEFQARMLDIEEYSTEAETGLQVAAETTIPALAQALTDAQATANAQDLSPHTEQEYEEWVDSEYPAVSETDRQTNRSQYEREWAEYKEARHEALARVVADLGDKYAMQAEEWREPPPPPPPSMPGNSTYNPPTGGVFGSDGMNSGGSGPGGISGGGGAGGSNAPGGISGNYGSGGGADQAGFFGGGDDDVADSWGFGSYGDLDSDISGGLAGVNPTAGPPGGMGTQFGGGSVAATGGGVAAGGAGLFGPANSGGGRGGGTSAGRGAGTSNSPARSGANSSSKSGSGSRPGSSTRGGNSMGRGAGNSGRGSSGARAGGRGAHSDDEEEESTRETWLKEDNFEWNDNTPREELDD